MPPANSICSEIISQPPPSGGCVGNGVHKNVYQGEVLLAYRLTESIQGFGGVQRSSRRIAALDERDERDRRDSKFRIRDARYVIRGPESEI